MNAGSKAGNYVIFAPQTAKGKYQKYANQLVAIISLSEPNGGKKRKAQTAKLYLTEEVERCLGKIDFVKLGLSGTNVGIIPMQEDDGECYKINRKFTDETQTGMSFINITAFAKYINLSEGVYSAHKEPGGVVEFNYMSRPSKA